MASMEYQSMKEHEEETEERITATTQKSRTQTFGSSTQADLASGQNWQKTAMWVLKFIKRTTKEKLSWLNLPSTRGHRLTAEDHKLAE
uniref:Uncharacterized protein n=1 Tax=Loa loa TaxID=7209 RepID=A0A1I7V649_LOALO